MTVARKQAAKPIDAKSDLSVSAFSHQQNLVRGTLAKVNSTTHHKSSAVFLRVLRTEIGKNLISARALLPVDRIDEYLKWLEDSLRTLAPVHFTKPIGFDYVGGIVLRARRVGLDRELKWIAKRIANDSTKISKFRSQCATLEKLIFKSRWSDAIECLIAISNEFGETYWGIQLHIALVQLSGGLEKQKNL